MPDKPKRKFGTGDTSKLNALNLVKALLMLSNQELTLEEPAASAVKVRWVADNQLQVTGENKIKNKIVEGTTKQVLWELANKTKNSLQLPQRQHENAGVNTKQRQAEVVQNVFDYLEYLGIWKDERPENRKNTPYWIFTLTLKHKEASIEDNLSAVKEKLQLEIVPQVIHTSTSIDWREVCITKLKHQQEEIEQRRKATEQGFEINVYVPLGLVKRKQQQRRQLDEQRDRENVYELTEEVIVKTYEHDAFLLEVIAQQPAENNQHIAIIGEPGAGKTTLLSTIASFIKDKTQDIPIFISLANLQGRTIEEYLLNQWLPDAMRLVESDVMVTPEIERQLIESFGKRGVWLLLDGVDEMGENSPMQALAKINQELTTSLRQARVVLTCRLNVWDNKVSNPLTGFDTYKTQEFKPEQIDDFIQQWFERADNLLKGNTLKAKLKENKHETIRKLVTNPLRLSLLCQTFDLNKQGELPETKAALYERFTRYFYEWKSELFPELYQSDDLKDELHRALSKLAFAGINSSARFRLRRSLVHQEMGERLFKLACDVSWLNLVDRVVVDDEEVYAFFHPNFQEYFASLKVNNWHEFLNHIPNNPAQGTYRIFQPQWKEVILLWLGRREEGLKQQQQELINALVTFQDGCGQWNREDVDKGFYEYQAYFLAAVGIAEFKDYSQSDKTKIVAQIVKWGFGYLSKKQKWVKFLYPIQEEAKSILQHTERKKAIAALVELLQLTTVDDNTRRQAALNLGTIDSGNEIAITTLVELLQSTIAGNYTRRQAALSLGTIGTGNKIAIAALEQLLQSNNLDDDTILQAADSLVQIDPGNKIAIAAFLKLLQSNKVNNHVSILVFEIIKKNAIDNEQIIAALVQIIKSNHVDRIIRNLAKQTLNRIRIGNETAINPLLQLASSNTEYRLKKINPGYRHPQEINALVKLLKSPNVHQYIRCKAIKTLGKIGHGNKQAINALVQLLTSNEVNKSVLSYAVQSLGQIASGNIQAINALIQLLTSHEVSPLTLTEVAKSIEKIGTGNKEAITALEKIVISHEVDKYNHWLAVETLKKILQNNYVTVLINLQHYLSENQLFGSCYSIIWHCAQNMSYPNFHLVWYQRKDEYESMKSENVSIKQIDLINSLQAAINNDSQLSQSIHLICIDSSKFIDPDNPASKIYTTIVKVGCPKCTDGTPKTMAELQTYWELLETDKRLVLMFHPGTTNTTDAVKYSDGFLNAISKFEGAICLIGDPIPNSNTLKVFAPNQAVNEILEWLRRG